MITFFRQRILLEFDNILEYKKYKQRYLKKGYRVIQSGVNEKFWFEVEKTK